MEDLLGMDLRPLGSKINDPSPGSSPTNSPRDTPQSSTLNTPEMAMLAIRHPVALPSLHESIWESRRPIKAAGSTTSPDHTRIALPSIHQVSKKIVA